MTQIRRLIGREDFVDQTSWEKAVDLLTRLYQDHTPPADNALRDPAGTATRFIGGYINRLFSGYGTVEELPPEKLYTAALLETADTLSYTHHPHIHPVPFSDSRLEGNLGLQYESRVFVTDPDSTADALGDAYESLVQKSGMSRERFNQAFFWYVSGHELIEQRMMNRIKDGSVNVYRQTGLPEYAHVLMESAYLKVLRDMSYSTDIGPVLRSRSRDTYKAAILVHRVRDIHDDFAAGTRASATPDVQADLYGALKERPAA